MNTTQHIKQHIQRVPRGVPFTTQQVMGTSARAAVDQALSRLTRSGKITRVTRGIYVRPEINRFVGKVLPEPFKVAKAIANKTNEVIQINGAEAARYFGLTTQVPTQPVYLTTGHSRKFNLGNLEITLKHVSPKKIPLSKSKTGLAIVALWHLGKKNLSFEVITKIKNKLSEDEFKKFLTSTKYMPGWMSNVIILYNKSIG